MKAVIQRPVTILNVDADREDWHKLVEAFDKFRDKYTVFSSIGDFTIIINPQKIDLDEPEMAEVFTAFNEVGITYGMTIDANFHNFRIHPETNRFYISIE